MTRDGLPRAYLRLDPNIDQTHPDPGTFVRLMCVAHRQTDRGRFKELVVLERAFGKAKVRTMIARADIEQLPDGRWYMVGWDEWQEGDVSVGDRMRRMRARRAAGDAKSPAQRTADWRLRTSVFERDGFSCRYCGAYEYPRDLLIAEHVIPDGPSDLDNLVTACRLCNSRKGGRTPEQAGMVLHEVGYRSPMDPFGDTPRVTRLVTRNGDGVGVTVTTDASTKDSGTSLGVGVGVGVGLLPPNPPPSGGNGLRANGTSKRQLAATAKQAQKADEQRRRDALNELRLRYYRGEITEAEHAHLMGELVPQ